MNSQYTKITQETDDKDENDNVPLVDKQTENEQLEDHSEEADSVIEPSQDYVETQGSATDTGVDPSALFPPPPPPSEKEIPPPDYYDHTLPPPYAAETVHDTHIIESTSDELLIDGLPVGHPISLIMNMFVTLAFDFVGFFMTYLLATSHAARAGSRLGLGFTFIRYALLIHNQDADQQSLAYKHYDTDISPAEIRAQNDYTAFLLSILGLFMCVVCVLFF